MTLTPAYGRDYRSKKAVLEDFDADKDFIINDITNRWDGKPVNKAQLVKAKQRVVYIRYGKLRRVMEVKL